MVYSLCLPVFTTHSTFEIGWTKCNTRQITTYFNSAVCMSIIRCRYLFTILTPPSPLLFLNSHEKLTVPRKKAVHRLKILRGCWKKSGAMKPRDLDGKK